MQKSDEDDKFYQLEHDLKLHVAHCEARFEKGDAKFDVLVETMDRNTNAIKALAEGLAKTHDVVQLHEDIQGVARIGRGVQTLLLWVIKWPLIGAGLYATSQWVFDKIAS